MNNPAQDTKPADGQDFNQLSTEQQATFKAAMQRSNLDPAILNPETEAAIAADFKGKPQDHFISANTNPELMQKILAGIATQMENEIPAKE